MQREESEYMLAKNILYDSFSSGGTDAQTGGTNQALTTSLLGEEVRVLDGHTHWVYFRV